MQKTLNDAKFLLFAKINKWLSKTNIEINKNVAICRIKSLHMLQLFHIELFDLCHYKGYLKRKIKRIIMSKYLLNLK